MGKFTAPQLAWLQSQLALAGEGAIPGTWLADGSITAVKLQPPLSTILAADITNWNTAYGWGNHALAGYQSSTAPVVSNWNTSYSWGNHAVAGYYTISNVPRQRQNSLVAVGGELTMTLTRTPVTGSNVMVTINVGGLAVGGLVWLEGTNFTVAGNIITFSVGLGAADVVQAFYTA